MPSTATVVTSALAVSAVSYLIYFDYQRRHNPEFRRALRKREQKYIKQKELQAEAKKMDMKLRIEKVLKESLAKDPIPTDMGAREKYFVAEVGRADELLSAGADPVETALAFYRALCVYPNPIDLMSIYDKSVKPPVLDILRQMVIIEPPSVLRDVLGSAIPSGGPSGSTLTVE
ncbi:uncharacterized protein SAPINGB_P002254 [Magnusiomyces paraingens]|uniref:Mitochondrial import receptor subunit TOM20 n=1 Tax=Magnusiomyces paraingens TaxID=2606893 RepID=A0A5E8BEC3_9ASCO|nr:uncharacterized protein SAPINGB_P002254 [Saprochaete ingens]VVT49405.1 unnamed protein product [Saprochaete ingens]